MIKNRIEKLVIIVFLATIFSACGGGGSGGSSGSETPPSDGGGGGGGGGTSNGNATFYSLSSDGSQNNDNIASAPSGAAVIASKFFIANVSGVLEIGVHAPTCLSGGSYKDYSLVLVSQGATTPVTTISMQVTSTGVTTAKDVFNDTTHDKTREGSLTVTSGTCTGGKISLTGGGTVISNGDVIVYKDSSGNLYTGLSSTVALNSVSNANSDISIDDGSGTANPFDYYYNAGAGVVVNTSTNNAGASVRVFNGTLKISSNITARLVTNTGVGINSYGFEANGGSAATFYRGVAGTVGGKQVALTTVANSSSASSVSSYSSCVGSQKVFMAVEQ